MYQVACHWFSITEVGGGKGLTDMSPQNVKKILLKGVIIYVHIPSVNQFSITEITVEIVSANQRS